MGPKTSRYFFSWGPHRQHGDEARDWAASAHDRERRAAFDFAQDAVKTAAQVRDRDPDVLSCAGHDAEPAVDRCDRLSIQALTSPQSQIGPAASSTFGAGKSACLRRHDWIVFTDLPDRAASSETLTRSDASASVVYGAADSLSV